MTSMRCSRISTLDPWTTGNSSGAEVTRSVNNAGADAVHPVRNAATSDLQSADSADLLKREDRSHMSCLDPSWWQTPHELLFVRYAIVRPLPPISVMTMLFSACHLEQGACYNIAYEDGDQVTGFTPVIESYCTLYQYVLAVQSRCFRATDFEQIEGLCG